jgi:PAS domain S-box-containing protein
MSDDTGTTHDEHCPGAQAAPDSGPPPDDGFRERKLALLNRIANAVLGEAPIEALMDEALQGICELLGTPRATVRLSSDSEMIFEYRVLGFPAAGELLPKTECPRTGRKLYRDGRPLLVADASKCHPYRFQVEALGEVRMGAFLGVPMVARDEFLGVLFVDRPEPHRWMRWEVSAAESVARQVAIAVRHARLFRSREALSEKLYALVHNVPGAVYHALPDGSFTLVGDNIFGIAGWPAADFVDGDVRWSRLILPDDMERIRRELADAVSLRLRGFRMEYRIRHRDGGVRWIADRHQLCYGEDGRVTGADGLLLDITDRHRGEVELQNQLRFLQLLIDTIPAPIFYKDARAAYLGCNAAFERFIGRSRGEIVGKTPAEIAPKELSDIYIDADTRLLAAGGTQSYEESIVAPDGTTRRVVFDKATFPGPDGSVGGIVGAISDITDLRRANEALRESEERYAAALKGSNDGIWDWNVHTGEVYFSARMKEMLGYGDEDFENRIDEWTSRIHPDDFDRVVASLDAHLSGGTPTFEVEYRLMHRDGDWRWILARSVCLLDETGEPCRIAGSHTDLSGRKRLEGELLQVQKMDAIGQLASGVAHDFNNMLTAIRGYADLVMMRSEGSEEARREIGEIIKASDRASALTQQLLAFSRKQVMQAAVHDMNGIVAGMEPMLRRLIGEHIDLVTVLQPHLPKVRVDRSQFEQVVLNLVVNARDAMPDGGTLLVETASIPHGIVLRVTDGGHGMDEATAARVFEPFFTTKEQGKGTGLGLSTVYGIVKQSGGDVSVNSRPGVGTTFRILLPAVAGKADEANSGEAPGAWPVGRETVLVVEDEDAVRLLVSEILKEAGYSVVTASNGEKALQVAAASEGPIHLLLTDVVMPRMGGRALAGEIRGLLPDAPVLYMSGYTTERAIRDGVAADGIAFLQKPFTPDALVRKVREVLDARRNSG